MGFPSFLPVLGQRAFTPFIESFPILLSPTLSFAIDLPGFGHFESRADVMSPRGMGVFLIKVAAHLTSIGCTVWVRMLGHWRSCSRPRTIPDCSKAWR